MEHKIILYVHTDILLYIAIVQILHETLHPSCLFVRAEILYVCFIGTKFRQNIYWLSDIQYFYCILLIFVQCRERGSYYFLPFQFTFPSYLGIVGNMRRY
jgi:hypothetical protein